MTRCIPQTYQMTEKEYKIFRGFLNVGYKASLTAALGGLAGIVIDLALTHSSSPENSQLGKEILKYAIPSLTTGGLLSLYFGINYYLNPPLSKSSKSF